MAVEVANKVCYFEFCQFILPMCTCLAFTGRIFIATWNIRNTNTFVFINIYLSFTI